jgi:hypothetical protein
MSRGAQVSGHAYFFLLIPFACRLAKRFHPDFVVALSDEQTMESESLSGSLLSSSGMSPQCPKWARGSGINNPLRLTDGLLGTEILNIR